MYETAPNIRTIHGFTTRADGVSSGIYGALNLGLNRGDDPGAVDENYEIICHALDIPRARLILSRQVHGTCIRTVTNRDIAKDIRTPAPYAADGLITAEKNLPLMIFTADCVPILLHDPVAGVIGAVHAGWRGTVKDIAGIAVRQMAAQLGAAPENIKAAIGPAIGRCCFETGEEVPREVRRALGAAGGPYITAKGEKYLVDLKGVNRQLLTRAGLRPENICVSPECTMCLPKKYWSHRYTDGKRGSQASIIML